MDAIRSAIERYAKAADARFAYDIATALSEDTRFHNSRYGDAAAGSPAEHRAADWLADQMAEVRLVDIEKVAISCDEWTFHDAVLEVDGIARTIFPHAYACAGVDGLCAEIIYLGKGTQADYAGIDARGKIVLVDVNQRAHWWVTYPMLEAKHQGAAAIISNDCGGFSEVSEKALNAQDICAPIGIPAASISRRDADAIKSRLEKGITGARMTVSNTVRIGEGVTHNIIGKIPGRCADFQIVVGAHYDKHFYGFQDDSCGVGLVLAMARGMLASGYRPRHDIVFCLHGAEEWGASGTLYDWQTGSWEMINRARPDWQGRTLAFLNFELPAYEFDRYTTTCSPPEMFSLLAAFQAYAPKPEGCFPDGVLTDGYPLFTYSDDFSYCAAGVPATVNGFMLRKDMRSVFPFYESRYHSNFDTKETYNENVMRFNLAYYGALAIYIDTRPSLPLNFIHQADRLLSAKGPVEYIRAVQRMKTAAEALYRKTLSAEGDALTKKNLALFKFAQDAFLHLMYERPIVPHEAPEENIRLIEGAIEALEAGEVDRALGEFVWRIDNGLEWYALNFSPEVIFEQNEMLKGAYWGTGKDFQRADVEAATRSVKAGDYKAAIQVYRLELTRQRARLKVLLSREVEDILTITQMILRACADIEG